MREEKGQREGKIGLRDKSVPTMKEGGTTESEEKRELSASTAKSTDILPETAKTVLIE